MAHRFSPEPAVETATRRALVRWSNATGIELQITEDGIPVILQKDYPIIDDDLVCGFSDSNGGEITVTLKRENCDYWEFDSLVLHEIGHMITLHKGHSATGIMASGGSAVNRECI